MTVLFADVTGSTGLGERLDPEHLKSLMGTYFEAMRQEIESLGGTVEKFIGDAVMAVFGVPTAHEDDAARALRAAMLMRDRLQELNAGFERSHGVSLKMRIGVNSGEVVAVTSPQPGEPMVTGDVVNVAARLEQNASPGEIHVSERTARAARGFLFGERGPMTLRGKAQPVKVFELLALESEQMVGLIAPMVGRDRELALLKTLYAAMCSESRSHLVTIYGDPGVGKSRLMSEFTRWAEHLAPPPLVLRGRCLPYGDGVTYWPLAEILKGHAGVLDTDPPDVTLEKIRKAGRELLRTEFTPIRPGRPRLSLTRWE